MMTEIVHKLDEQTMTVFARKGQQGGPEIKQTGNANGVKVRRIMQITRDLSLKPFNQLRVLDLACGEGVYSIEAGLRGADVTAVDARSTRMDDGRAAAERLGLSNVKFRQQDIRELHAESCGSFDAIFFLGILYHLDAPDIFPMMRLLYAMCAHMLIIDTHITDIPDTKYEHNGESYDGKYIWEHDENDPQAVRNSRLLASLDNPQSFYLSRQSLFRVLTSVGFTSVFQCHGPFEPGKSNDRITIVAIKSEPVKVSSYPWVNDKTDEEIEVFLNAKPNSEPHRQAPERKQNTLARLINRGLRRIGLEIKRVQS